MAAARPSAGCAAVVLLCGRYYAFQALNTMSDNTSPSDSSPPPVPADKTVVPAVPATDKVSPERPALDPTRYGDWEKNGRCIDF